jgi:hypothetical protein
MACAGCTEPPCAGGVGVQVIPGHAIALAWDAAANATSYVVVRSVDDGAPEPIAALPASERTYTDANVTVGHTYAYSVTTGLDVPLDSCPASRATLADASVPFFAGPGLLLGAAGAALGTLMVLLRRR